MAVPHISGPQIQSFEFRLPPPSQQRSIADILSTYDDLIENNTRRIRILEEMAAVIYREWFVHFRFPGHQKARMVESPLGELPEGWKVRRLYEFGTVVTGKTPSKARPEYFGPGMPFIKLPDMHGNMFCISTSEALTCYGVESQSSKTLPANSLCVSCIGTAGVVSITAVPSQTNQQINSIVLSDLASREFLYFAICGLKQTIQNYGSNGATMTNLNKGKFESLQVVMPSSELMHAYSQIAAPMFEVIRCLQLRNRNLRQTRDLLLPKLISGEVDVSTTHIDAGGLLVEAET